LLQLTLIELKKADRLRRGADALAQWVRFFEHWREEKTMSEIEHAPVQRAMNRVRELSADERARRLAFVRERALHDEVSLLKEAREEGREEGRRETARNLIALGALTDAQIAQATGLSVEQVEALR
jgi:predicted transposase/invertase (TIGR01784 family)